MTPDQEIINGIFEQWRETYFSAAALAEIEAAHGPDVRRQVEEIYSLTDMGGGPGDLSALAHAMTPVAHEKYPWLSPEAIGRLSFALVMTWK